MSQMFSKDQGIKVRRTLSINFFDIFKLLYFKNFAYNLKINKFLAVFYKDVTSGDKQYLIYMYLEFDAVQFRTKYNWYKSTMFQQKEIILGKNWPKLILVKKSKDQEVIIKRYWMIKRIICNEANI